MQAWTDPEKESSSEDQDTQDGQVCKMPDQAKHEQARAHRKSQIVGDAQDVGGCMQRGQLELEACQPVKMRLAQAIENTNFLDEQLIWIQKFMTYNV